MTPELSRKIAVSQITDGTRVLVEPDAAEQAALSRRMGLSAIVAFTCQFDLQPGDAGAVRATGHLAAQIVQTCVVSMENFETLLEEDFAVRFVPESSLSDDADFDLHGEDEIAYTGAYLDLGEAAAEQLALALDPFPRKPGAVLASEPDTKSQTPFAALRDLRQ